MRRLLAIAAVLMASLSAQAQTYLGQAPGAGYVPISTGPATAAWGVLSSIGGVAFSGTPAAGNTPIATSSSAAAWGVLSSIGGVAFSGTPAAGSVPIASSSSAAAWGVLSSVGGVAFSGTPAAGSVPIASSSSAAAWVALAAASPIAAWNTLCNPTSSSARPVACQYGFIHSKDMGATGLNVVDDATALQNWINACQTNGVICFLDSGTYKLNTALSVTAPVSIYGAGFGSSILAPAVGIDGIDINTTVSVRFEAFAIQYPSAATVGTSAISVTATGNVNSSSIFRDMQILNAANCANFVRAGTFDWHNNKCLQFITSGVVVQNQNNVDQGDSTIEANYFQGLNNTTTTACIQWVSSGGIRVVNNKCVTATNGLAFQLASAAVTAQMIISANSWDGLGTAGSAMSFARSGATGTFGRIVIADNICNGVLICVQVPNDANGIWLTSLNIVGNTYIGLNSVNAVGFVINDVQNFIISNNSLQSQNAATVAIFTAASANLGVVGPNIKIGTFAANSISSTNTTTIAPN